MAAFGVLLCLYLAAVLLGAITLPGHRNASGAVDLGHWLVPPLRGFLSERQAEYVWWLGTLPLEAFFAVIVAVVAFTGRGFRLALCLYAMYALHWLFLHATTLLPPDDIVWRFPEGVFTFGKPFETDLWFSGHTANAFVIALATRDRPRALQALAWSVLVFETWLVLAARTHYTIDVLGGLFVGYTTHRLSLDLFARRGPS
jgi:PAP2 superfamily C-terminal